jgi:hypothetical protein
MAARRTVTTRTTRESKVTSRMSTGDSADAPPEVETGGLGYADAIVLVTTVLLLAAFVLADCMLGKHFGKGIFFK